ncbi:glycoside hydrolase family 10 and carbohydrate-binding module family 1 protein [Mucidula mucida]|nr:glycoside hydrolase family 10 and carbohydrate-binding module family 1 protein [Mucidula mucida]
MRFLLQTVSLAILLRQCAAVAVWGQCDSGTTCVVLNDYYSQCQPGTATTGGGGTGAPAPTGLAGLNAKWVAKGKKFWGSCADSNTLNIAANAALLESEFGQVTPENSMKWDSTEATRGVFTFSGADALVDWAVTNDKKIRGHTLVWYSQLPSWVSSIGDSATLTSVIQNHISTVMGRYAGKLYGQSFSPIECLNEDGTLRTSVFYNVLGENFVSLAFTAARAADSTAKLYINDYNLDSNNAKVQGMVALVKRVNSAGTLIDAIGTQMHLSAGGAGGAQAALTALAASGVSEVAITELDIAGGAASDYTTVVNACLAVPECVAITSWGVSDVNSWRASETPDLFDSNYQPKPAYEAVIEALS